MALPHTFRAGMMAVGLLGAVACDDQLWEPESHVDTGLGDDEYSQVRSIMSAECTGCHATGGTFPDLSGDFVANVYEIEGNYGEVLVVPGDSASSFLYEKVAGTISGDQGGSMPIGGTLSESQLATIASWIDNGALGTDATSSDTEVTDTGTPATWDDVQAVLDLHCLGGCHGSGDTAVSPIMTSDVAYENLFLVESSTYAGAYFVMPGYPQASLLYRKLAGTMESGEGASMPYGEDPLSAEELRVFRTWIEEGAQR